MKLEITTSSKAVEVANMILGQAAKEFEINEKLRTEWNLSVTDINQLKAFRKALLKSFANGRLIIKT